MSHAPRLYTLVVDVHTALASFPAAIEEGDLAYIREVGYEGFYAYVPSAKVGTIPSGAIVVDGPSGGKFLFQSGFEGRAVDPAAPGDGYAYTWSAGLQRWIPAPFAASGGPPTGPAGGGLAGVYPNPEIRNKPFLIYKPGGVAADNVFDSWPALYLAFTLGDGAITIQIDDSIISPAPVPAGVYNFAGRATITSHSEELVPLTKLSLADGAVFEDLQGAQGPIEIISNATVLHPLVFTGAPVFLLDTYAKLTNNGSIALCRVAPATTITVEMWQGSTYESATTAPFFLIDAGANVVVVASMGSSFATNHAAAGLGTFSLLYDPSIAAIPTCPALAGAYNKIATNAARYVAYADTAPLLGSSDVQGAIDALKSKKADSFRILGAFTSSETQVAALKDTAYYIRYDASDVPGHDVSLAPNTDPSPALTRIVIPEDGVYEFQFSPQVSIAGGTKREISFWLEKNRQDGGGALPKTNSVVDLGASVEKGFQFLAVLLELAAGDYIEVGWSATENNTNLQYLPAQVAPLRPANPSIIANVKKISTLAP